MDSEKVIKGLEMCTKPTPSYCRQCPYRNIPDDYPHCVHDRLQQDVISLLKEQDVVRCKDCKHGCKSPTFRYYPDVTWCNKYLTSHNDEWFCADGERR